jgi:hypothetical protein
MRLADSRKTLSSTSWLSVITGGVKNGSAIFIDPPHIVFQGLRSRLIFSGICLESDQNQDSAILLMIQHTIRSVLIVVSYLELRDNV